MAKKPLGYKAYGSIPHLPGSRKGPGDHGISEGQARMCCKKAKDKHDEVIIQEKLDGSNVAIAKIDGQIVPLSRSGYRAETSPYEQHHFFAKWVFRNYDRFMWLEEKQRLAGEWLAQAHSTRYDLSHEPFVAFDIMTRQLRLSYDNFLEKIKLGNFISPRLIHRGDPFSVEDCLKVLEPSGHGAIGPVEGAVWRVESKGSVNFLAKFVRPEKKDGIYLSSISGKPDVWNWRP